MRNLLSRIKNKLHYGIDAHLKSRGYFRDIWYPRYEFQMTPRQLCFLADCLDRIEDVDGAILEIGCAHGLTTTFLYEYMIGSGFKKDYICIDTFAGFTKEDIAVEADEREKDAAVYGKIFKDNNPDWFKEALRRRNIHDVRVIHADISQLKDEQLPSRIAFCIVDVDLYRPVLSALRKVYPRLSSGGVIVVDDCWYKASPSFVGVDVADVYDGAMQAYREFTVEHNLPEKLVEEKLGLIELA